MCAPTSSPSEDRICQLLPTLKLFRLLLTFSGAGNSALLHLPTGHELVAKYFLEGFWALVVQSLGISDVLSNRLIILLDRVQLAVELARF